MIKVRGASFVCGDIAGVEAYHAEHGEQLGRKCCHQVWRQW